MEVENKKDILTLNMKNDYISNKTIDAINNISFNKVLVTGGTGFIGKALISHLLEHNISVIALARDITNFSEDLKKHKLFTPLSIPKDNIPHSLEKLLEPYDIENIFHLASAGIDPKKREVFDLIEGTVALTASICFAIRSKQIKKFIYTGSCSEYSNISERRKLRVTDKLEPTDLYGAAKASAWIYARALAKNWKIPFITMRLFGVYGKNERADRLIPHLINHLSQNKKVPLTKGEQIRDWLNVDDVVNALILVANEIELESDVYNLCSGVGVSVRHVCELVAFLLNKPENLLEFGAIPYRDNEAMYIVGDESPLFKEINWQPKIDFEQGILEMLANTKQ